MFYSRLVASPCDDLGDLEWNPAGADRFIVAVVRNRVGDVGPHGVVEGAHETSSAWSRSAAE